LEFFDFDNCLIQAVWHTNTLLGNSIKTQKPQGYKFVHLSSKPWPHYLE